MGSPDLQEIHDFLLELARKAGEMITSAKPPAVDTKINSADLVTKTDKAVEAMIFSSLQTAYPTYSFLGEESSPTASSSRLTSSPTFVVDPIDGTTNFVHRYPYVSISLAFTLDLKPLVGIIYNPFTQKLYSAIRGKGAFLTCPHIPNSFPYPTVSSKAGPVQGAEYVTHKLPLRQPSPPLQSLKHSLVAVEWGTHRSGPNWDAKIASFSSLAGEHGGMAQSLRSLGSAALNMCSVAAGELDAYWEGGCWAWDVAAGWVVVVEAGGLVVGGNAGEWDIPVDGRRFLVVRGGEGRHQFIEEFWGRLEGKLEYEGSG